MVGGFRRLKQGTIYVLRILSYFAAKESTVRNPIIKATELSKELGVSYNYMMKILGKLGARGLMRSELGRNGGYRLTRGLGDISLYEICRVMNEDISFIPQAKDENKYDVMWESMFTEISNHIRQVMQKTSFADMYVLRHDVIRFNGNGKAIK